MDAYHLEPWQVPGYLDAHNGHFAMDGVDLAALARARGTPLFVFSERRLRANAAGLVRALAGAAARTRVCYAAKACSNVEVLRVVRESRCGIEVNSGGELHLARAAGFADGDIVFNGVAKTADEIASAVGIKAINVDSLFELERIAVVAARLNHRFDVALRAIPNLSGGTSPGNETGAASSKFGMLPGEVRAALHMASSQARHIKVVGLHVHIGSQIQNTAIYGRATNFAVDLATVSAGEKIPQ